VSERGDIPDVSKTYFCVFAGAETTNFPRTGAYIFTIAHHVAQQHTLQSARHAARGAGEVLQSCQHLRLDPALEVSAQQCLGAEPRTAPLCREMQATFSSRRDGRLWIRSASAWVSRRQMRRVTGQSARALSQAAQGKGVGTPADDFR